MIKIGIDAMGGDNAPEITVLGAMDAIKRYPNIEVVLYGDEDRINEYLTNKERISIVHTKSIIDMGEKDPISEIRRNRDSSMIKAFTAGKLKEVDAVVSAGPTQALVVASHLIVKRIKEMKRVALAPICPTVNGRGMLVLDVGANVELRAEHINDLAYYASIVSEKALGRKNPVVGYLNIGTEPGKGREVDKEAFKLLKDNPKINFFGNVEPKEALTHNCDIIICDGYIGNIFIKTMEGTAKGMGMILKEEIKRNFIGKIAGLLLKKNLKRFKNRMNPSEVGGAMVCGLNVPVVKAHGSSDGFAFMNAIRLAKQIVEGNVVEQVIKGLRNEEA